MEKLKTKTMHGKTKTKEYRAWRAIKQRCNNPKTTHYSYYGGRGIKMCDRWMASFECFLKDMGNAPSKQHTVDRIKNHIGYNPKNCRWATRKEQQNNTRWNVYIERNGEVKTLSQWSEILGLHHKTIAYRIRSNWPLDKLLVAAFKYKTKTL